MLYLLQVIIYTALMYGIYILFLRNRTMHTFNRAYLLASALLPLVLPFIKLSSAATSPLQRATIQGVRLPEIVIAPGMQTTATNIITIAVVVYALTVVVLLLFKARQWYKLQQVIGQNEKVQEDGYTLVLNSGYGPGSWGKYIFIPAEATNDTIINHELAHIQLRHTADVMLLDIMQVFFWPNIFLIWLCKELVQVHEFQADAIAATEKHAYGQLLVSSLFHTCTLPSSHSFIIHPIKRRIKMLNKKNSIVPRMLALLATGVAMNFLLVNIIAIQSCNTKKWDADSKRNENNVAFLPAGATYYTETGKYVNFKKGEIQETVYKMPEFQGNMMEFMGKNIIYPEAARQKGIGGRVVVKFVINTDGSVVNTSIIKSPDTTLSMAAMRVVNMMPKWASGETETGEHVPVAFVLPVQFKM